MKTNSSRISNINREKPRGNFPAKDKRAQPKPIVVVLGMHRSGTSLLTRLLNRLGMNVGDDLLAAVDDNPEGYWELKDICETQEKLLGILDRRWNSPAGLLRIPDDWFKNKEARRLAANLRDIVARELDNVEGLWGFKDPRTATLLPVWDWIFEQLNVEPVYLLAVRAPDAAVVSLEQRTEGRSPSETHSRYLWLRTNVAALELGRGRLKVIIDYDTWFEQPEPQLRRLWEALPLADTDTPNFSDIVKEIIKRKLHRNAGDPGLGSDGGAIEDRLYGAMKVAAGNGMLADELWETAAEARRMLDVLDDWGASILTDDARQIQELTARAQHESNRVATLEGRLHSQRELAAELRDHLLERRERAVDLQERTREKEAEVAQLHAQLAGRDTALAELRQQVGERDGTITDLMKQVSDRDATVNDLTAQVAERDAAVVELEGELAVREESIRGITTDLEQMATRIEELEEQLALACSENQSWATKFDHSSSEVAGLVEAIGRRASHAELLAWAGSVCGSLGFCDTARQYFEYVLSIEPGNRLAADRLERLLQEEQKRIERPVNTLPKDSVEWRKALDDAYQDWVAQCDTLSDDDRAEILRDVATFARKPLVSVIVPAFNTPEKYLRSAIESVRRQLYENWELCVADDASTEPHVRAILDEYAECDKRIKVVHRDVNGHISAASNSALESATGEYVALLDHDDELTEHALYWVVKALNDQPWARIVYSDEDKIDDSGRRTDPHFKSDWNPDLLLSQNYICHLTVYDSALVKSVGGFRAGVEGSQDHDLVLRCSRGLQAAQIIHVPKVLYHWRMLAGSTAQSAADKAYTTDAGMTALRDHFAEIGQDVTVAPGLLPNTYRAQYPLPTPEPLVSLLIPTRDGLDLLQQCVSSILDKTTYANFEILILDNQSQEPATHAFFQDIQRDPRVRVVSYDHPFNFSAINNFGARQARGELIGLINNDVEVISSEWLTEMVSHACRPEIGCVGAKLYYPDDTVQHAGVILGIGEVAGHSHKYYPRTACGYFSRLMLVQDLSAVTGACLIMRKELYERVGGLDEENLTVAFNDVDLCIKVREAGYRNLWTPYAELYHHESVSRGHEDTPEKQERFRKEIECMVSRWGDLLKRDPCYSPNLNGKYEDFSYAWISADAP